MNASSASSASPPSFRPPAPQTLAEALRGAAAELELQQPPPELLARVEASLAARPVAGQVAATAATAGATPRGQRWAAWLGAGRRPSLAFATVLAGSAVLLALRPPLPLLDAGLREGSAVPGFVPVAPVEHRPQRDTPAWLVSTELQRERLSALGLPYDPGRAGEAVRAELLLHPSGEVLAVRLLN